MTCRSFLGALAILGCLGTVPGPAGAAVTETPDPGAAGSSGTTAEAERPQRVHLSGIVDEVHLDLGSEEAVRSACLGQRPQPFGVFETPQITEPLTQSAYETKVVGATAGVAGRHGITLTATLYQGAAQMDQMLSADLLDPAAVRRSPSSSSAATCGWRPGASARSPHTSTRSTCGRV